MAMESKDHPVVLSLTRQNVPVYAKESASWKEDIMKGGYVVKAGSENPDVTIVATGSEVGMALEAAEKVSGKTVRVVSVMDKNLFEAQSEEFQTKVLGESSRVIIAEAGCANGWEGWVTDKKDLFTIDRFGESGPGKKVAEALGFTADKLAELINA